MMQEFEKNAHMYLHKFAHTYAPPHADSQLLKLPRRAVAGAGATVEGGLEEHG